MKKCTRCLNEREDDEFSKARPNCNTCKFCLRKAFKEYYDKNREKHSEKRKKWYEKNRDYALKKSKETYRENWNEIRDRDNASRRTKEFREKSREYVKKTRSAKKGRLREEALRKRKKNPEKHDARRKVTWAIKLGIIERPKKCEKCMRTVKPEAHHEDYSKPLEVQWLCKICHNHVHNKLLDLDPKE